MRLSRSVATKPFLAGTAAGLLFFAAANVRSYRRNPCFFDEGQCGFGFPFEWGYGVPFAADGIPLPFDSEIIWGGLAANFLAALIASILLGLSCNKLFKRRAAFR